MSDKQQAKTEQAVAIFRPARLPYHPAIEQKLGVDQSQWRVLIDSVWPGAKSTDAVCLAISYCKARHLDPFKRPVHIVPMWNSTLGEEVETVWPGISEVRTTAARTGEYGGADETVFGEERTHLFKATKTYRNKGPEELQAEVTFPTWARVTVYRIVKGQRVAFPGPRVVWMETYSWKKGVPVPNDRWARAPYQMLEKCAEAAALRKAFPEELGADLTAEEMEGKLLEHGAIPQAWATEPAIDGAAETAPPSSSLSTTGAEAPARTSEPVRASAPVAAEKGQGGPQGAATASAGAKPGPAPQTAPKASPKPAAKPKEPKDPPADAPPADENGDPLAIPAALDRRGAPAQPAQQAAPSEPEAPADNEPRKMPYQGPPGHWADEFIKLIGRMETSDDVDELERLNQKLVAFVNLQDKPAAGRIDAAFIAHRAALAEPTP